jgi:hypothetical protein
MRESIRKIEVSSNALLPKNKLLRSDAFVSLIVLAGIALSLAACTSNGFVASWKAPDATPLQVTDSKVAAIVMIMDEAARRAAEDALVRELNARGASGVPMYSIMPDARADDEASVRAALQGQGYAGAVVMRPIGERQEVTYSETLFTDRHYRGLWGGYYGYGWGQPWGSVTLASHDVRTKTIVSIETLVYSLRQNKLVWGGQSRATNPSNVDRLIHQTARKVAKELERQGLFVQSDKVG